MAPVRSSKVKKPPHGQSTLSSFFGLSNKPLTKKVETLISATLSSSKLHKVQEDKNAVIDLTSDDSEILRDISNKKSILSSISSDGFSTDTKETFIDDLEPVVRTNLKSNRPIGLYGQNKTENTLDYVRTNASFGKDEPLFVADEEDEDEAKPEPFSQPIVSTTMTSSQSFTASSTNTTVTQASFRSSMASKQRSLPWAFNSSKPSLVRNPRMKLGKESRPSSYSKSQIVLSDEQEQVLHFILQEKLNIFYTGSAGTGKSVLLKELIKRLYKKYGSQYVAVTASTGLAAVNIGGQTINRFSGIGLGKESVQSLVLKVKKSRAAENWKKIKVLIIDEVSMIDGNLFHKLNQLAKLIRQRNLLFGGIQVVITGDFYQLPPVPDRSGPKPIFCFQSPSWNEVIQRTVMLTKVFRQKGDEQLINMLNALRLGLVDQDLILQFLALQRPVTYADGIAPTELFPLRHEVDRANRMRLEKLPTKLRVYKAADTGAEQYMSMLDNVMAVKELHLKEDAQVMYLKNKNELIVNGSVGKVLYFVTPSLWEKINNTYRDLDSEETIFQIRVLTQCVGVSSFGPELELQVKLINKSRFTSLVELATRESTAELLPVVKFSSINGISEIELIEYDDFAVDIKGGAATVSRRQLPLLLSWAISIHKSQGQTLERVKVDLNKVFEKGQVYVALSRAVSKEALQITGFNPLKVKCSEEVKSFYEGLERLK